MTPVFTMLLGRGKKMLTKNILVTLFTVDFLKSNSCLTNVLQELAFAAQLKLNKTFYSVF